MAEIIRATGPMVAEDFDPSQDLNEPRTVLRELNFDFGQFFYPQEKRKIFDIRYFQRIADDHEVRVIVKPDATLGTLTTFDERVFYALIEIWQEQHKPNTCSFSEREIARRIKVKWGRQSAKAINQSLKRLRMVGIEWLGAFYDSTKKEFVEIDDNPFSILNHLRIISTKNKGVGSQEAEFRFDDRVVQNLNSNYCRPVRFDVILSFNCPLAQAMYTFSEPKLYGTKQYHRKTQKLVEDLGLQAKSYRHKSIRARKFGKLQGELIGKPTGFGEVIEHYEIRSGKDDAVMEIGRSGEGRIKGKKVEVTRNQEIQAEVLESLQSVKPEPKKQKASEKLQELRQESKEPQAREAPTPTEKEPPQSDSGLQGVSEIFDGMTSSTDASETLNAQSLELLTHFDKVFRLNSDLNLNDVPKAELFIERHGIEAGKFLVDFAHRQGCEPARFSDILTHRAEALKEFERKPQKSEAKVIPINAVPDDLDLKAIHHFHQKFGGRIQASDKVRSKVKGLIKAHGFDFAIFLVDFVHKKISDSPSNYHPKTFSGILNSQGEAWEEWEKSKRRKQREDKQAQRIAELRREDSKNLNYKIHRKEYIVSINELYERVSCICPERIAEFESHWTSKEENNTKCAGMFWEDRKAAELAKFFKDDINIHFPFFDEWYSKRE